jgi:hypothetical protein
VTTLLTLIGQSLELSHPRLHPAVLARDQEAVLACVVRQIQAGAGAVDVNGGVQAGAADYGWCARIAWDALPGIPLLIDAASPALIAEVLTDCRHTGLTGPLVANALPVRGDGSFDTEAMIALHAAALADAGVVVSPRGADGPGAGNAAEAYRIASAALFAADAVRSAGVAGPVYVDALAFPPLSDRQRCARSIEVLRAWRDLEGIEPLTAVGNVGYGADAGLARRLRAVYAAAAVGAGARALILPVEEAATVRAALLANGDAAPVGEDDHWLVAVAEAAHLGTRPPGAPEAYEQAARLILGDAP